MEIAILIVVLMTCVGLLFGLILAIANKKFEVEVNPLIHMVEDVLPKGQCGACGYAGCIAYAEAVVLNEDVAPNLCIPGKEAVAKRVAELTGKVAEDLEPRYAYVNCDGCSDNSVDKYEYDGIKDCIAANILLNGQKACEYGCLGMGTCVKNCPFDAIEMGENNLPFINKNRCTGCGKCQSVCPKKVISMVPIDAHVQVKCNNKDIRAVSKKSCNVSCLGCGVCAKKCEYEAIKVENNLAVVNNMICIEKCSNSTCAEKCPTKAMKVIRKQPELSEELGSSESC